MMANPTIERAAREEISICCDGRRCGRACGGTGSNNGANLIVCELMGWAIVRI